VTGFLEAESAERAGRNRRQLLFRLVCLLSTWLGVAILAVLLLGIGFRAFGWLDWQFLSSFDSSDPVQAGILAAAWGSLWLTILTIVLAVPVGVGAAVYLEEYSRDSWLRRFIQLNLSNLAGVPSIVYGILGLSVFVQMFRVFGVDSKTVIISLGFAAIRIPLPFGPTIVSGAATMALLILPIVIVASQEALRAIPPSIRHASLALGATRWQTIRHQVLPAAIPGIMTGVILSISRAVGETAPLIMVGAATYVAFAPGGIDSIGDLFRNPEGALNAPFDDGGFTVLPIQIYNWIARPNPNFQRVAAAGILVLLLLLLGMNSIAIFVRQRFRKRLRW